MKPKTSFLILIVVVVLAVLPLVHGACSTCECNRLRTLVYPGPKAYSLEKAFITMTIMPDGTVEVSEAITFDFYKGKFSFAYRDIEIDKAKISDVQVTENGEQICFDFFPDYSSGKVRIKWYYDEIQNSERIFTVHYKLKDVITVYEDYADLYWQVWGSEWAVGLENLEGIITLPGQVSDPMDVYTWGHPRLEGKIGMQQNQDVVFQTFDVPSNQWVEVRVAFPRDLLTSSANTIVKPDNGLEIIIEQEQSYSARVEPPYTLMMFFAALPSIILIIVYIIWVERFGREPKIEYNSQYERDIPYSYSPAIVSALINQASGKPSQSVIGAVILDLVRRKVLKLNKIKTKNWLGMERDDYELSLAKPISKLKQDVKLTKSEKKVLAIIHKYMGKGKVSFSEMQKKISRDRTILTKVTSWQKEVKSEIEAMQLLTEQKEYKKYNIMCGISLALSIPIIFFFGTIFFSYLGIAFGVGMIIAAVLGLLINNILTQALPRRTPEGALHHAKWMALKRFLNDFSQLKTVPVDAVVLWEQYLVYAIALGVAYRVQKHMQEIFKNIS
ncbi:DUF2207 domain-containing protein, partial [Candidatus Woesearchaeota archaeon]|nr:DUF2207 domain-containing protein [Candidatus Woesearchaeota archaeon]